MWIACWLGGCLIWFLFRPTGLTLSHLCRQTQIFVWLITNLVWCIARLSRLGCLDNWSPLSNRDFWFCNLGLSDGSPNDFILFLGLFNQGSLGVNWLIYGPSDRSACCSGTRRLLRANIAPACRPQLFPSSDGTVTSRLLRRPCTLRSKHSFPLFLLLLHHKTSRVHVLKHVDAARHAGRCCNALIKRIWRIIIALLISGLLQFIKDPLSFLVSDFLQHEVFLEVE